MELLGEDHLAIHSSGPAPFGHDAHPLYRASRLAALPRHTKDETARGLTEALEQASIAPWVRAERQRLLDTARTFMHAGELTIQMRTNGVVSAGRLAALREGLERLPALYRALWRASGFPIDVVGQRHTALPDLIERERKAGVPGVFEPRMERVYLLPGGLMRTDAYAVATVLEEVGHGLDVVLGRVLGLEGHAEGSLPGGAVYRSAQADFGALYQRYKATVALPPYYRSSRREFFAYGIFSYYLGDDTLKKKVVGLYRFMEALEREVTVHVAGTTLATSTDHG